MAKLALVGLKSRSYPLSNGLAVYRLRDVLDSQRQNEARAALHELGALDAVQEDGATSEELSRYLAGPCELPDAAQLSTFESTLLATAERFGIEAAHFFELATELKARDEDSDPSASSWKAGSPPSVRHTPFPLQGLDAAEAVEADETFEELSVAVKLATAEPGTLTLLDAFHTFWVRAYVDTDADSVDFRSLAVGFDAAHHAGMLGIDNAGGLPIALPDVVRHLAWVLAQLHTVIPVVYARLNPWCAPSSEGLLLAGNPVLEQLERKGEPAALACLNAPSVFDETERAAMCVEIGQTFDPESADALERGLGWFDRALALVPQLESACGSKITVLLHHRRLDEALAVVPGDTQGAGFVLKMWSEIAPEEIDRAAALITPAILDAMNEAAVAALVPLIAEHAPALLDRLLAALPAKATLVGHLANAVNACDDDVKLTVWLRMLDLPIAASGPHRENYFIALNSACVTTHARKSFEHAAQLADRAQPYLTDNPHLTHSCACAYAAVGRLDDAMAQVQAGVALNYDHLEQMEVDSDLDVIRSRPSSPRPSPRGAPARRSPSPCSGLAPTTSTRWCWSTESPCSSTSPRAGAGRAKCCRRSSTSSRHRRAASFAS